MQWSIVKDKQACCSWVNFLRDVDGFLHLIKEVVISEVATLVCFQGQTSHVGAIPYKTTEFISEIRVQYGSPKGLLS